MATFPLCRITLGLLRTVSCCVSLPYLIWMFFSSFALIQMCALMKSLKIKVRFGLLLLK